jgi:hypothetical protein
MHLSELWIYPVKSCRGISVASVDLDAMGPALDRRWMLVDDQGEFMTQRDHAKLASVETAIEAGRLVLARPGADPLELDLATPGSRTRAVTVWGHACEAHDEGDVAGAWFSDHLDFSCHLVRMPRDHRRPVGSAFDGEARTAFTDGYPVLVISEASLADLNARLEHAVPMNRFRPNFVVRGVEAYGEDAWSRVRIGGVEFQACKPCARCVITTIDQTSGQASKEPLRTLSEYRKQDGGVMFGQNLVHLGAGTVRVGDPIVPTG